MYGSFSWSNLDHDLCAQIIWVHIWKGILVTMGTIELIKQYSIKTGKEMIILCHKNWPKLLVDAICGTKFKIMFHFVVVQQSRSRNASRNWSREGCRFKLWIFCQRWNELVWMLSVFFNEQPKKTTVFDFVDWWSSNSWLAFTWETSVLSTSPSTREWLQYWTLVGELWRLWFWNNSQKWTQHSLESLALDWHTLHFLAVTPMRHVWSL